VAGREELQERRQDFLEAHQEDRQDFIADQLDQHADDDDDD
jgi:hypothetical protein